MRRRVTHTVAEMKAMRKRQGSRRAAIVPGAKGWAMKGVVLAGGTGSRLWPLTKITNKHLLPIGCEPMILHPIRKLLAVGILDICVVTGADHAGEMLRLLGSGTDFDCEFTYRVQDHAGGVAEALGLAHNFAQGDMICVILGDNILQDDLG